MSQSRQRFLLCVIAIVTSTLGMGLGIAIRYRVAQSDPFWLDELHTVWAVEQSEEYGFDAAVAAGNQAPFYYGWLRQYPPSSESTVNYRLFSIVCSTISIASLGFFVWYWTRSFLAPVATIWLAALDPQLVFLDSEARPYALVILLSIWQFFFVMQLILNRPEKAIEPGQSHAETNGIRGIRFSCAGLFLFTIFLLYTHHIGLLLIATECLIIVLFRIAGKKLRLDWFTLLISLLVLTGAVIGLQYATVSHIFQNRMQWSSVSSIPNLIRAYLPALVYLFLLPLIVSLVARKFKQTRPACELRWLSICVAAWALLPMSFSISAHYFQLAPLALYRYTVVGAIAFPVFAGVALANLRTGPVQLACVVCLIAGSLVLPLPEKAGDGNSWQVYPGNEFAVEAIPKVVRGAPIRMRFESWDATVKTIESESKPEQVIFLFSNLLEDKLLGDPIANAEADEALLEYLKFPLTWAGKLDSKRIIPRPTLQGDAFSQLQIDNAMNHSGFWVVIRGDEQTVLRISNQLGARLKDGNHETVSLSYSVVDPSQPEFIWLFHISQK